MSSIRFTFLPLASLAFLALGGASALQADTVFSNVTNEGCNCGYPLSGDFLAVAFTPAADYLLTGAAAELQSGNSNGTADFAVYSNSSANLPGTSLTTLGSATLSSDQEDVLSVASPSASVDLFAGIQYWLVLTPGTSGTLLVWEGAGSSSVPVAYTFDTAGAGGWEFIRTFPIQFQINGTPFTPVPEPASAWLLLTAFGIVGLACGRRRYGESRSTIHSSPFLR